MLAPYGILLLSCDDFYRNISLVQGLIVWSFNDLIFVLALADSLCCVLFVYPIWELAQMSGDRD
jgi:hypothetical protein